MLEEACFNSDDGVVLPHPAAVGRDILLRSWWEGLADLAVGGEGIVVLFRFVDKLPHDLFASEVKGRVDLSLDIHASGGGHLLGSFVVRGGNTVHLLVVVQNAEVLFHLGDFVLEMQQYTVVKILKTAVKWRQAGLFAVRCRAETPGQKSISGGHVGDRFGFTSGSPVRSMMEVCLGAPWRGRGERRPGVRMGITRRGVVRLWHGREIKTRFARVGRGA